MHAACETTENVDLSMFTAKANVTVKKEISDELVRCMKKVPPSELEYSLIYVGHFNRTYFQKPTDWSCQDRETT